MEKKTQPNIHGPEHQRDAIGEGERGALGTACFIYALTVYPQG